MIRQFLTLLAVVTGLVMLAICVHGFADAAPPGDAAATTDAQPSRWPMNVTSAEGAGVTIFQPQLEDFQGDTISARAAVAVTPAGQQEPVFGAMWLQSRVETDRSNRTVRVMDVQVTKVLFPTTQPITTESLSETAKAAILSQPITLSLDHLLASLEVIQKAQEAAADLETTPPAIIFRDHPAIKVQYDGTPRLVQASDTSVMRVINTPFFVALDTDSRTYFLKGAGHWFNAPDPMGPFQYTRQIPAAISQLADSIGYSDPQQAIPDDQVSRLEIVTANSPTELIWSDGQPQMSTIPNTGLLYWANTDSDVFLEISTQKLFTLLSGRWYSAANANGSWTFVAPDQLPADFAQIPADNPKASVLAQVAGTQAAQDAVADTAIPQTAAIDTTNYDQPPVSYDGDPSFQPIQGTSCSYAVNTDCSVVSTGGVYYCCYNAAWYQCATPVGPWVICRRIPHDIYTIPPSCPIYPVSFCHIYGFTNQFVYVGYTPGYVGCYPYRGVVVYGTGFRYQPWYRQRYVPRPFTFGFAAQYHPYSGRWGFSFGLASGGGQTWIAAPGKGRVDNGGWFGYGGYRPTRVSTTLKINRTIIDNNNVKRTDFDVNVYQRRNDLRREAPGISPTNTPKRIQNGNPSPRPGRDDLNSNDVYVNPQGDVYRRTQTGWQKREGNQWNPQPEAPSNPKNQNPGPPEKQPSKNKEGATPPHEVQKPPPPARAQPAPEPKQQEPRGKPADNGNQGGAPDRDYNARQRGNSRSQQNSPPPPPPPRAEPEPRQQPQQQPRQQPGPSRGK